MTAKDCGHHDDERKKLYRRLFAGLLAFTILILFIIFLIWAILRPTKPQFTLVDATISVFNVSSFAPPTPNVLTSDLQITLSSRNPNDRIGIYYDKLDVFASYRSQQITVPTLVHSSYQGHKESNVWSPVLCGTAVPVAPYLGAALCQDLVAGTVLINIKVDGRVRFKVGTFISGTYHLNVNCQAYILVPVGPATKCQLDQICHVEV